MRFPCSIAARKRLKYGNIILSEIRVSCLEAGEIICLVLTFLFCGLAGQVL